MKALVMPTIKKLKAPLALLLTVAFSACSKESIPKCEKWEVEDIGYIKVGCIIDFSCERRTSLLEFCGDDLKDVNAGNTITIDETNCCTKTRTFVRQVE